MLAVASTGAALLALVLQGKQRFPKAAESFGLCSLELTKKGLRDLSFPPPETLGISYNPFPSLFVSVSPPAFTARGLSKTQIVGTPKANDIRSICTLTMYASSPGTC